MRILLEVIVYDILVAAIHLSSDIFLVYSYFHEDDPWWGGVTILAICLPGLLGKYQVNFLYHKKCSISRNAGLRLHVPSQRLTWHQLSTTEGIFILELPVWTLPIPSVLDSLAQLPPVPRPDQLHEV